MLMPRLLILASAFLALSARAEGNSSSYVISSSKVSVRTVPQVRSPFEEVLNRVMSEAGGGGKARVVKSEETTVVEVPYAQEILKFKLARTSKGELAYIETSLGVSQASPELLLQISRDLRVGNERLIRL